MSHVMIRGRFLATRLGVSRLTVEAGGKQSTMILWQIMDRIRKSSSFASIYKKRLLEAGVIGEPRRGEFNSSFRRSGIMCAEWKKTNPIVICCSFALLGGAYE
ncbi:hypothetical protein DMP06_06880 [Slackia equolifaciens]|uniref:Uncharacterized protein n=1 Tax=Slackia equolifaciens TaxID=498718 RepID=A0A3N0AXB7_9ACTN|nr:hypothetical protein DMP06_06880 [Slackia equolifaciens]